MPFLGDLERFGATSLYPWRFAIAALAILAAVGLFAIAARRGWLASARRHPGRTGVPGVAAFALLAPTAWQFGSPLFVRTELQEPPPAAVVGSPIPSSDEPVPVPPANVPPSTLAPTPAAAPIVHSGTFVGADDFHFGRGRATLIEAADGSHTLRFDRFSVRNGPDLSVYLSTDARGYANGAIELGRLRAIDGSFNTPIPAGTDVGTVRSVVIWCKGFAVLFAVAALDG
jgi:hypothetical protein